MSRRSAWQAGGPATAAVTAAVLGFLGKQHVGRLDAAGAPLAQEKDTDGDDTAAVSVQEGGGDTSHESPPLLPMIKRRFTHRRTTGPNKAAAAAAAAASSAAVSAPVLEDDLEWTPEGGGSMQFNRHTSAVRRGLAAAAAENDELQQGLDRKAKKKGWEKRLEEAAKGEGKVGRGTDKAAAARVLQQLQAWETRPPGPCDKYNSISSRFLTWQTRRRECNFAEGNCVFMGRSVTGWCIPEAEAALYEDVMPRRIVDDDDDDEDYYNSRRGSIEENEDEEEEDDELNYEAGGDFPPSNDPEGPMVETELLQSLVTIIRQEGIEQPVRLLITGSLAEAMTDSLKDGQSGSQELAKELVMEVLTDPNSPDAIQRLLHRPDLRASIRQLLQSLVYLPYTKFESHRLLKQQLTYLLTQNRHTELSLASACHTLLHAPIAHQSLLPLLKWTFSPSGPLLSFATDVTSETLIPLLVPATTDALKGAVRYALEHDYVKELTKDSVKDLLLRVAKMHAIAAAEAARKRQEEGEEEGKEGGKMEERLDRGMQGRGEEEEEEDGVGVPAWDGEA
eukprot:evm.model.NODE_13635_length_17038_cov_17.417419.5